MNKKQKHIGSSKPESDEEFVLDHPEDRKYREGDDDDESLYGNEDDDDD